MQQFSLNVVGFDGDLEAILTFGDETVASFPAKTLKQARSIARSEAQRFLNENRPARRESYSESFTV